MRLIAAGTGAGLDLYLLGWQERPSIPRIYAPHRARPQSAAPASHRLIVAGDLSAGRAEAKSDDIAVPDLVIPSLDAGDEETFQAVNRPCEEITLSRVVDGLCSFRERFDGAIWLEVFLLGGTTDSDEHAAELAALIGRIRPDRIQVNTVERPPADASVDPAVRDMIDALVTRAERAAAEFLTLPQADVDRIVHAMAHITGGGLHENLQRILPSGVQATIDRNSWTVPPVFPWLQRLGEVEQVGDEVGVTITLQFNLCD